jgi:hypothetical protein
MHHVADAGWRNRFHNERPKSPTTNTAIRALVGTMTAANPLWGAPRIHGELGKLGIAVSERTVSRLLRRPRRPPSQTWRTFLTHHVATLVSMDFFTVPTPHRPRALRLGPTQPPAPANRSRQTSSRKTSWTRTDPRTGSITRGARPRRQEGTVTLRFIGHTVAPSADLDPAARVNVGRAFIVIGGLPEWRA